MKFLSISLLLVALIVTELLSVEANDTLNSCLGIAKRDLHYCVLIKNKDKKRSCFGIIKRNTGYCTMILDEDLKNRCLAITLGNIIQCKKISNKDLQKSCQLLYKKIDIIEFKNDNKDCKQ